MIVGTLTGPELGGFREDLISKLGVFMGPSQAAIAFDQFEQLIEERAAVGAGKKVTPMIVGSMVVGGVGLLLGGAALILALRR